ncbi:leucine-rich repeat-containing protein [Euroglyphus maynei]|uniref:Leucine-rich repeat-containing protein n=1 Tax=Euroglyphus maynei TaxID=6958 RepID=A0A1Y3ARZ8_EURMA|nr:leucine-rich repeat-containing protein [Euroglyphus maynei]
MVFANNVSPFFSPLLPKRCPSPPCVCDVDDQKRKTVTCTASIQNIPIDKMDPETQVINITPKQNRYNALTLGRIFTNMTNLEEIRITQSKLPAIGEMTFCPLHCNPCQSLIKILDLSHNNINAVLQGNFYCLDSLEFLDLSDNNLSTGLPSAPFGKLSSLLKLSLARNKLNQLVPLMFHSLNSLEELDLSENPLSEIRSDELRGLPNLRLLNLNGCQLARIDGFTFRGLTNLEYLDLSDNHLKNLNRSSFDGLMNLRVLLLHRNSLTVLPDRIFAGLNLNRLDLSNNLINPLTNCVFCLADAIKKLDLSNNKITSFSAGLLEPISDSLEQLYIDRNRYLIDSPSSVVALLQPLRRLKLLSAAEINLDESLPESAFDSLESLVFLNISNNRLTELNSRLLSPMAVALTTLDVSNNKLPFIDPSTFLMFSNMRFLSEVYLHGNPFSCYRCQILPFIDWLNTDPAEYWKVCPKLTDDPDRLIHCARCSIPSLLEGRYLHEPGLNHELEWCTNPEVQLRLTASEPQVGLVLAFLIILSLVALILVVIAIYRKHGATYYTQEDKLTSKEEIYAASVAAQPLHWATKPTTPSNHRMISLSSTNCTTSRQNTVRSPQSSIEQPTLSANINYGQSATMMMTNGHRDEEQKSIICNDAVCVGCTQCANSTAVKQVIASIPAMTEMLQNSLNQLDHTNRMNENVSITKINHETASNVIKQVPPPLPAKKPSISKYVDEIQPEHQQLDESESCKQSVLLPPIEIDQTDDHYTNIHNENGVDDDDHEEKNVNIYI